MWVHPKRGRDGIDAGQVMGSMTGIAVHDAWAPYDTYTPAGHQLCCAHLLRELTAVAELAPQAVWSAQAADALLRLEEAAHRNRPTDREQPGRGVPGLRQPARGHLDRPQGLSAGVVDG